MERKNNKHCPKCKSIKTKKNWKKYWRQSYLCKDCWHCWVSKPRKNKKLEKERLKEKVYYLWAIRKQTYRELAEEFNVHITTIKRWIDSYKYKIVEELPVWKEVILLIDTTYFWDFWVMVFQDAENGKVYYSKVVDYETYEDYKEWIEYIISKWVIIKAIVCDWRKWLLWWFKWIPTQMCHFHQKKIIRKYLTKRPRLEPNKELKNIVNKLWKVNKEEFEKMLNEWYDRNREWLNTKTIWEDNKWHYVHRKTQSAYFSLKRNLKYLYTYEEYKWKINIPTTTNGLESIFGKYKTKVNLHWWLKKENKIKLINYLLYKPVNKFYKLAT